MTPWGILRPYYGLIRQRWEEGATDPQIADELLIEHGVDVTVDAICLHRYHRDMKSPNGPGRPRKFSDREIARMRRQREDMSLTALSQYWGACRETIWRNLRRAA